jgi:hypothetical protein
MILAATDGCSTARLAFKHAASAAALTSTGKFGSDAKSVNVALMTSLQCWPEGSAIGNEGGAPVWPLAEGITARRTKRPLCEDGIEIYSTR